MPFFEILRWHVMMYYNHTKLTIITIIYIVVLAMSIQYYTCIHIIYIVVLAMSIVKEFTYTYLPIIIHVHYGSWLYMYVMMTCMYMYMYFLHGFYCYKVCVFGVLSSFPNTCEFHCNNISFIARFVLGISNRNTSLEMHFK